MAALAALFACVSGVAAAQGVTVAQPDASELEIELSTPVVVTESATPTPIDDDRVWEDISYGTGEADFTAIAIDPENPRRLYAGAAGYVYVSDDGGVSWLRVLRVRGSSSEREADQDRGAAGRVESEVDDRVQDLREELVEEIKREITDELVAELGEFGEQLAEELAEELAEQQVDEAQDQMSDEARAEVQKRESGPASDFDQGLGANAARVVEPRRIHRILALPRGRVLVASGSGVFESTDRGETFSERPFGAVPAERDVRAIAVHPLEPNKIIAGTLAGLYVTVDGGDTWTEATGFPGKLPIFDLAIDPGQPLRVTVGTDQGVYRSVDGGLNFVAVSQPSSPLALFTRAVAYDPVDPRIVFAGTQEGLYRSLNGGEEWERLEPPGLIARDIQDFASAEWGLVAATSNGLYLSADSGASFRELYAGLDSQDVRRTAAGVLPLNVYAATGRGLFTYRAPEARARKQRAVADIRRLLAREPGIADVAAHALTFAGADQSLASWRERAAIAPLLPKIIARFGAVNPTGVPYTARTLYGTLPTLLDTRSSADNWQVTATWDASRLLFNEDALRTSSQFRRLEQSRARVLRRVVNTYNARRRLQISLLSAPPADLRSLANKLLQVDELTAVLDGLTDGSFTNAVARNEGASPPTKPILPAPAAPNVKRSR